MTKNKESSERSLSSKIKKSAKSLSSSPLSSKKISKNKISVRTKAPELSVINVIERISLLLRKEAQEIERKKASGE